MEDKMKKVTHTANLDKLVEDFVLLEQKIAEIQGNNSLLEIQLEEANRLVKLTQTKENCWKEECVLLHGVIDGLQGTIQKQYNVRDENGNLKRRIKEMEENLKLVEQEDKEHVEKLQLQVNTMEQEHQMERAEIHQKLTRQFETKEAELKGIIDKKETEIQLLNRQLCSQEREKQSEIIKLQMEFNSKLVKIQSTSMKSPHHDLSVLPHNIFKRKLQHLQEEKNREIAGLRRTIRELEQQQDYSHSLQLKRRKF
ncbi:coiled-coil domain-containing protein 152-like [Leucoraja erinacea]|uniref:coiled-coil domain-containing protein 152-like n=1 Tax=Leucoraja erinaceus TaxID=7782 RepID=UPI0024579CFB|nr:coiled-coil domain-containing protein 152-like [Leucoraja erinacea]